MKKIVGSVIFLLLGIGLIDLLKDAPTPTHNLDLPMIAGVPGVIIAEETVQSYRVLEKAMAIDSGYWTPNLATIIKLEERLRDFVDNSPPSKNVPDMNFLSFIACKINENAQMADLKQNSLRQYMGIIYEGRKFIHVIGISRKMFELSPDRIEMIPYTIFRVADAGPTSFYAVYDTKLNKITRMDYDVFFSSYC